MVCPSCNTKISHLTPICPVCQIELLSLAKMAEMPDYYFNLALGSCDKGDWFSAVEALAVAHALNPSDFEVLILSGKIYIELQQLSKAASCFIKALKIDARNQEAQGALQWLQANGCKIPLNEF